MSATYHFQDFAGLIEFVAKEADKLRKAQSSAQTQKASELLGSQAVQLEYIVMVMRNSNLNCGKFILPVDIDGEIYSLERAILVQEQLDHSINSTISDMKAQIEVLKQMKEEI